MHAISMTDCFGRLARPMAILAIALFCAGTLWAQGGPNTLTGLITDSTHAPVPEAIVSIKNAATGASAMAHSDAQGNYTIADVQPGSYQISVSASGFNDGMDSWSRNDPYSDTRRDGVQSKK